MTEQAAWSTLRGHLKDHKGTHIQRLEDKLTRGIPDCNVKMLGHREAWLEGKHLDEYPKRVTTPVRIGLKKEQSLWLFMRSRAGGDCFVWCRLPDGWALFWDDFMALRRGLPRAEFDAAGLRFSNSKLLVEELRFKLADWKPMSRIDLEQIEDDGAAVLLRVPGNGVADRAVVQASVYERRLYPDIADGNVDYGDAITSATAWRLA